MGEQSTLISSPTETYPEEKRNSPNGKKDADREGERVTVQAKQKQNCPPHHFNMVVDGAASSSGDVCTTNHTLQPFLSLLGWLGTEKGYRVLRFIPVSELERCLGISGPSSSWIANQGGGGRIVETPEAVGEWDPGGNTLSQALEGPL